jgi:RNA polymerase sigma factor for flagellar operon FliA
MSAETALRQIKKTKEDIPQLLIEEIFSENLWLVDAIAKSIGRGLPSHIDLEDLRNSGVIGLMEAIERFDPEKNCCFRTYAGWRIEGEILDYLRSLGWFPRWAYQKKRRLEKIERDVTQRLGRKPEDDELADACGITLQKFYRDYHVPQLVYLEDYLKNKRTALSGVIEDHSSDVISDFLLRAEKIKDVQDAIAMLPERERLLISLYFYEDLNMREIGSLLGIVESRAWQLIHKAYERLETLIPLRVRS